MTDASTATRSIVVERAMPHPPEKVWRALTQGRLIEAWLMKNDFQPVAGHRFSLRSNPMPHWTRTPVNGGRLVRMEQSGFRPEHAGNYQGAKYGWQKYFAGLEQVAAGVP
jgi:uncharacterized protein YndB with AHSA1/START domain